MARQTKTDSLASAVEIAGLEFAAKRFGDVRINEISKRAHCSPSTLYQAFGDKAALFVEATRRLLADRFSGVGKTMAAEKGVAALMRIVAQYAAFLLDPIVQGAFFAVVGERVSANPVFTDQHTIRCKRLSDGIDCHYVEMLHAGEATDERVDFVRGYTMAFVQRAGVLPMLLGSTAQGDTPVTVAARAIQPFLTPLGLEAMQRWVADDSAYAA